MHNLLLCWKTITIIKIFLKGPYTACLRCKQTKQKDGLEKDISDPGLREDKVTSQGSLRAQCKTKKKQSLSKH